MNRSPALDDHESGQSAVSGETLLARVRVVLTRPSHPGNIGAAARAMKTMGLSQLWLVAPERFPDPVADARASGATDLLQQARVVATLDQALAGTVFACALTARRRELSLPRALPREAAAELRRQAGVGEVAVVFGNETNGLSNDEAARCNRPVTIPTSADFSSLNLGAAVQLMCYELRLAALEPRAPVDPSAVPARLDEVEGLIGHFERAAIASGFHDPDNPRRLMPRVRRLLMRAGLEKEEVGILRGFIASLEQQSRLK